MLWFAGWISPPKAKTEWFLLVLARNTEVTGVCTRECVYLSMHMRY